MMSAVNDSCRSFSCLILLFLCFTEVAGNSVRTTHLVPLASAEAPCRPGAEIIWRLAQLAHLVVDAGKIWIAGGRPSWRSSAIFLHMVSPKTCVSKSKVKQRLQCLHLGHSFGHHTAPFRHILFMRRGELDSTFSWEDYQGICEYI